MHGEIARRNRFVGIVIAKQRYRVSMFVSGFCDCSGLRKLIGDDASESGNVAHMEGKAEKAEMLISLVEKLEMNRCIIIFLAVESF